MYLLVTLNIGDMSGNIICLTRLRLSKGRWEDKHDSCVYLSFAYFLCGVEIHLKKEKSHTIPST